MGVDEVIIDELDVSGIELIADCHECVFLDGLIELPKVSLLLLGSVGGDEFGYLVVVDLVKETILVLFVLGL